MSEPNNNSLNINFLYKKFKNCVQRTISFYFKDYNSISEITNVVFTKVYSKIDSFDENKGSIEVWIKRIAKNYCLDLLKSPSKIHYTNEAYIFDYAETVNPCASQDNKYLYKVLTKSINELNEKEQAIIKFRFYCEYDYKDIAEEMKLSINRIGVELKRALKKLKRNYDLNIQ